eukprot:EG_transcript_35251
MHPSLRVVEKMLCTEPAELYFPHKVFTPEGCLYLMDALRQNTTLRVLQLRNCHLGPEGARSFAVTVTQNTTLRSIRLEDNVIGPEGAKALAEALRTNSTLWEVNLKINFIGDYGATALAVKWLVCDATPSHQSGEMKPAAPLS